MVRIEKILDVADRSANPSLATRDDYKNPRDTMIYPPLYSFDRDRSTASSSMTQCCHTQRAILLLQCIE